MRRGVTSGNRMSPAREKFFYNRAMKRNCDRIIDALGDHQDPSDAPCKHDG